MENRIKAARTMTRANLLFFGCMLLAVLAGAFAVTANGSTVRLVISLVVLVLFLIAGAVIVLVHYRVASRYLSLAKEEEARLAATKREEEERTLDSLSEDGLPGEFCREIRGYSPAQLRLILDDQSEEYSAEEFAFIQKVLAEEEAEDAGDVE